MEGMNYLTSGDLALHSQEMRGYAGAYGYGYGCEPRHRNPLQGGTITAVGLAAAAVLGVVAIGWGVNSASKARLQAAENLAAGNSKAIDILANNHIIERQSRETWQNQHAPSMTQYVDVRTGAGAFSGAGASALASASADALALNAILNGGGLGRNGQTCPQPVALYQPAMPCRCNTCCEG